MPRALRIILLAAGLCGANIPGAALAADKAVTASPDTPVTAGFSITRQGEIHTLTITPKEGAEFSTAPLTLDAGGSDTDMWTDVSTDPARQRRIQLTTASAAEKNIAVKVTIPSGGRGGGGGAALSSLAYAHQVQIIAHPPGLHGATASPIARPPAGAPYEYFAILRPNTDSDDAPPGANPPPQDCADDTVGTRDDDLVALRLRFNRHGGSESLVTNGALTLILAAHTAAFGSDRKALTPADCTLNLGAPKGPLAPLAAGNDVFIWVEAKAAFAAAAHASLKFTGAPDPNPSTQENEADTEDNVLLLPVELVDTKNRVLDDGDDVNIEPKATADEKKEKSIAWIEPHGAENTPDAPDMPQLALRFRGTETMGLKIKWKLAVKYNRPRGNQPNEKKMKEEDEVYIPKKGAQEQPWQEEALDGAVEIFDHAGWIAALVEKGFFGGEAELKYQLLQSDGTALGTEEKMLFSIGGKNPERAKCKKYIDDNATSAHGNMWFAYAIAKSESSAFNPGERYNQFWKKTGSYDKRPHKQGDPTWAKASWEESAGGFGIFQVTGDISSKFFTIPREQIWNWQKNVSAGLTILRHKQDAAYDGTWDYMNGTMPHQDKPGESRGQRLQAKKANKGVDLSVPDETVRGVTFTDGTADRRIEAAVTIKAYNGAARHYVGWNNAKKKWEFFRTNGKFNYVDRVCQEVE